MMGILKNNTIGSCAKLSLIILVLLSACQPKEDSLGELADKPLFRDSIYDGAADPVVVWNKQMNKHVMYYTNRRANVIDEEGVSWVHGTRIGMATSADQGATWQYYDTCDIGYRPDPDPTYWAPDVIEHKGTYHMYLTYVPGVFADWRHPRYIIHLTSKDGIAWDFQSKLPLDNEKVLDATVYPLPDGGWRLWYNNEMDKKSMYYADSPDLYQWENIGKVHGLYRGEGAKVFHWNEQFWMFTDEWRGLGVYHSSDLENWVKQPGNLLSEPGTGEDDVAIGQHCDVVVNNDRAFIFYFTHPGRQKEVSDSLIYEKQRSSIQVAELVLSDSIIDCDRDIPCIIKLGK